MGCRVRYPTVPNNTRQAEGGCGGCRVCRVAVGSATRHSCMRGPAFARATCTSPAFAFLPAAQATSQGMWMRTEAAGQKFQLNAQQRSLLPAFFVACELRHDHRFDENRAILLCALFTCPDASAILQGQLCR